MTVPPKACLQKGSPKVWALSGRALKIHNIQPHTQGAPHLGAMECPISGKNPQAFDVRGLGIKIIEVYLPKLIAPLE